MKNLFFISVMALAVSACNKEPENLMTPCVGAKGSPCAKTPLNHHLLQKNVEV